MSLWKPSMPDFDPNRRRLLCGAAIAGAMVAAPAIVRATTIMPVWTVDDDEWFLIASPSDCATISPLARKLFVQLYQQNPLLGALIKNEKPQLVADHFAPNGTVFLIKGGAAIKRSLR